jgi:hypothetical protein
MPRFIVPLCEKAGGCVAAPSQILLCCVVLRGTTCGYVDHLRALFLSLPLPLLLPSAVCLFNFANPPGMSSALYDCPSPFCRAECISSFSFPFSRHRLAPARPSFHHTFRCGSSRSSYFIDPSIHPLFATRNQSSWCCTIAEDTVALSCPVFTY